jgi:hypothetical protein
MKRKVFAIATILVATNVCAEDAQNAKPFFAESTLSSLLERIPNSPVIVSWLPEATVVRYDDSRFDKEKSMPAVRELYEQWCKAKLGKIYQPRNGNCTFLRNGLGCAVGELQQPGLGTDFERGIKDAATGSGDTVQVIWPKASWLVSSNALFNIFLNKGANQISIVGGLQRCMDERNKLLNAMAFVSINDSNNLVFLDEAGYEGLSKRGAELSKAAAEKKKEEAAQQKALAVAKTASLNPGEYVVHLRNGQRGMVIEIKPPLAQIQWDKGYGAKSVEWNRLDELRPERAQ